MYVYLEKTYIVQSDNVFCIPEHYILVLKMPLFTVFLCVTTLVIFILLGLG